jgi:hypothetical protein
VGAQGTAPPATPREGTAPAAACEALSPVAAQARVHPRRVGAMAPVAVGEGMFPVVREGLGILLAAS